MGFTENSNEILSSFQLPLLKRDSPVVWSHVSLDPHLYNYAKDGYAIIRQAANIPEAAWIEQILSEMTFARRPGLILERNSEYIRSQFDIHHQFPHILQKIITKQILDMATQVLGDEPLLYQSHVNFKYAQVGGAYDWHSDYTYWREQDGMLEPRAISIVIPLASHGPSNGGLQLFAGSQNFYYSTELCAQKKWNPDNILHDPHENGSESGLIPKLVLGQLDSHKIHSPQLEPGDYLVMDANTWHYSPVNTSLHQRATLFVILIAQNTPFDQSKLHHRPSYITCREGVPLKHFLRTTL